MSRWMGAACASWLVAIGAAGCRTGPHPPPPRDQPTTVEGLAAAIAAIAQRSDDQLDAGTRERLSAEASTDAAACLAQAPAAAACLYYHAVALGLEARAHPLRAGELLKNMLDELAQAQSVDPTYDHAGPARVRALVLVKAPGWPLGPGDPEAGLAAAHQAAETEPAYAPNALALAGALAKTGDAAGAHRAYLRARELANASTAADRIDWLRQAEQGLSGN